MIAPKFRIIAQKPDGTTFEAFRWCRDAESGIARARYDAQEFGVEVVRFWAVPVQEKAA